MSLLSTILAVSSNFMSSSSTLAPINSLKFSAIFNSYMSWFCMLSINLSKVNGSVLFATTTLTNFLDKSFLESNDES